MRKPCQIPERLTASQLSVILLAFTLLAVIAWQSWLSASQPETFTFVVIGDNRPNRPDLTQPEIYKKMLKEINSLEPAFVVNTGDWIYGSADLDRLREQYSEFTRVTTGLLREKMYLTIGNHEVRGKARQEFFEKELGDLYYSFDVGGCHFAVLNSELHGAEAKIAGPQLEWLKQDLRKSRVARHKFVFVHRPLYAIDGHMGRCLDRYPRDRDVLHNLLVRNLITAVFAGHEHLFYAQVKNGVRYITTGGGGADLYPSIHGEGDYYHYVVVSVSGNKVEMKVVKPAQSGKPSEVIPIGKAR